MIQIRIHRRLRTDDVMLIFACATLIAANVILYLTLSDLYWDEELLLNPGPTIKASTLMPGKLFGTVLSTQRTLIIIGALSWTSIYAIKLCFLLFFHQMIRRLQRLVLVWKIVLGITVLFYCISLSSTFISCNRHGMDIGKSSRLPVKPGSNEIFLSTQRIAQDVPDSSKHFLLLQLQMLWTL